jgi:DNA-binding CsgD family transcriptional regulator
MVSHRPLAQDEDVVREITRLAHGGLPGLQLLQQAAAALRPAVPFDASCAATTDPITRLISDSIAERETADEQANQRVTHNYFHRVYFEHDFGKTVAMVQERQTVAVLSETTLGRLDRSGRFTEHLQPRGLAHEVYTTFVDHGLWGELHLTRARGAPDFTPREVDLIRRIGPHIGAGLRAAALRPPMIIDATEDAPGVIMLDAAGRVVMATAAAERLLAELSPLDPRWRAGVTLPVAVHVVLAALERTLTGNADQSLPRLRARTRTGRWLTLHASLTQATDDLPETRVVIVAPALAEEIAWLSLASYGLSAREEEVVKLVVRGRSTKQIARDLSIAEHTVQRHMSNIFEKVGVRGRRMLVKELFVEQVLPNLTPN